VECKRTTSLDCRSRTTVRGSIPAETRKHFWKDTASIRLFGSARQDSTTQQLRWRRFWGAESGETRRLGTAEATTCLREVGRPGRADKRKGKLVGRTANLWYDSGVGGEEVEHALRAVRKRRERRLRGNERRLRSVSSAMHGRAAAGAALSSRAHARVFPVAGALRGHDYSCRPSTDTRQVW